MQKLRVLFVEDEEFYIKLLRTCINYSKYFTKNYDITIVEALTYHQARLCLHEQEKFDISIIDYKLPSGKTGKELVEDSKLVTEKFGQIVFTTIEDKQNKKFNEFEDISGFLVLDKPFYLDQLEDIFKECVRLNFLKNRSFESPFIIEGSNHRHEAIYNRYDILFIESHGTICDYYLMKNNKIVPIPGVSGHLSQQAERLKETELFLRVHNEYLVNVYRIKDGAKMSRKKGWLSFIVEGTPENSTVAYYSRSHPSFHTLQLITKIDKL